MRMSNKAKAFFEKAKLTEEYWVNKAKMDFSTELARNASQEKINGKTLADKIGTSAAYISKVFRGQTNLTIESMVKLARATGANIEIKFTPYASAINTKKEESSTSTHFCQIIDIPTPMMKALTAQKTELGKAHVRPKFLEQFHASDPDFALIEDNLSFLASNNSYGKQTMWHESMQYNKAMIVKKSNG